MLKKFEYIVLIFMSWVLLGWHAASAQTRFSISQVTGYDQNIFRNYLEASDWVNQTALNFQHEFQIRQAPLRVSYSGDLNLFYDYRDRMSHAHQIGLESVLNLNEQLRFQFGALGQLRKFTPDFEIYDYQTLAAYAQLHVQSWQTTPIQLGYRFRQRDYQNLSELSYQEHQGFIQIKHFFPTRTTFIGELNFGQKKYADLQTTATTVVVTPKIPGRSWGKRYGMGGSMMPSDTTIMAYNMTALQAQRVSLSLKLAQSLFSKTGLSLEYVRQFEPENNIRYLTGMDYSYSKDDELYDDPYAYSSHGLDMTLTQILPWQSTLKMFASLTGKSYLYSIASDSTLSQNQPNESRTDQQQVIGMVWQKNFKINRGLKSIAFFASVNYLANESNDRYFDFEGFFGQSGLEFIF